MINFIILNYKSINDTINCINSINAINTKYNKKIIVVDNNSIDEKGKKSILKYTEDLIELKQNIGFAKGNNVGCKYAIKKYNPDFLCVINSDIIIEQQNFIEKIYELYNKHNFDILGPKILPIDSNSVNPFPTYKTLSEVNDRIKYTKKILKIYKNFVLRFLLSFYLKLKKKILKDEYLKNGKKEELNVPLHGCALIFSKKYIKKYDDIFYNDTFLFHEEEFLFYRMNKDKLLSLYSPEIELIHKEGQSLNKQFKNYKKEIFRYEEILKSLYKLKAVMENNQSI